MLAKAEVLGVHRREDVMVGACSRWRCTSFAQVILGGAASARVGGGVYGVPAVASQIP